MNMCPDSFFWTDLPISPSENGPSARAAMISGSAIVRAWESPRQNLNPKTGLCWTVCWDPNINNSYLGKAYSEIWFSNACSVSTLVDRDQSILPAVAPQHGPSSLQANCWPLLSLPGGSCVVWSLGWLICRSRFPPLYSKMTHFSLLSKISLMARQKSSSGNNPLWALIFPPEKEKENKEAEVAICAPFRVVKSLAWRLKAQTLGRMASFQPLAFCCKWMGWWQSPSVQCRLAIHDAFTIPSNPRSNKGSFDIIWDWAGAGLGKVFPIAWEEERCLCERLGTSGHLKSAGKSLSSQVNYF